MEDMARLALREGREDAVLESREHADERQGHAAYPDLPPEVPRDEEGIRKLTPVLLFQGWWSSY